MITLQGIGLVVAIFLIGFVAVVVFAILRWIRNPGDRAGADIDSFLRSGKSNPNPSHIPPTYSLVSADKGWNFLFNPRYRTSVQIPTLDAPKVQRKKYEDSLTTTQKELRAIE